MSAPRKFDEETRARAVRLYQDRLHDRGESKGPYPRMMDTGWSISPNLLDLEWWSVL